MARWTDLAEWVGPSPNQSGAMSEHRGLVIHTASGYYKGTIAWQHNSESDVSSHFVVAGPRDAPFGVPDGKIGQVVDTDVTAWTQRDGNGHWLSVECSGFGGTNSGKTGDKLSAAQIESCARLLAKAHAVYGVPLRLALDPTGRGLGYHSMGAENGFDWGHLYCPGEPIKAQLPAIVTRAIEIVNGDDAMKLYQVKGQAAVWAYDGVGRRHVPDEATLARVKAATGATVTVLASQADLDLLAPLPRPSVDVARLDAIAADVAEIKARPSVVAVPVDQAALDLAVGKALSDMAALHAVATAVADELHKRTES